MHHHFHDHIQFAEHGRGGGRHRARRGAVPIAIFTLLEEQPMRGYEIITELKTRSDGRWRPSAGSSIRPSTSSRLAGPSHRAKSTASASSTLTDRGSRDALRHPLGPGQRRTGAVDHSGTGGRGDLRRLTSELAGQIRQIARFGTAEQRDAATAVLEDAKRRLYAILAAPPETPPEAPADTPAE